MLLETLPANVLDRPTILLGDSRRAIAILIDPADNVARCLEAIERNGLELKHVFATSDDSATFRALVDLHGSTGAWLYRSAELRQALNVTPVFDGSMITIGSLRLHCSLDRTERGRMTMRVFELLRGGEMRLVLSAGAVA